MIPITYNYTCSCGYHHVQREEVQVGAYIRLLINAVLLCPECKQRLQPQVLVAYAAWGTNDTSTVATLDSGQDEQQVG
jgi:hypothetical protein